MLIIAKLCLVSLTSLVFHHLITPEDINKVTMMQKNSTWRAARSKNKFRKQGSILFFVDKYHGKGRICIVMNFLRMKEGHSTPPEEIF